MVEYCLSVFLTPFPRRGFAADGTSRGPAFARPPRPNTPETAKTSSERVVEYSTQFYVYPLNPGKRLVFADSPRPLQRRGPSQDGPTVIRETQDGYGRSSSSLPDLGPPSKSATSCESVPSMRRAFCDSAAPRSSMSADERGMHKLSSAAGSVTCECFQTNYHHQ